MSAPLGSSYFLSQFSQTNRPSFADHEPGLWRAVITQALMDAATQSSKSQAKRARNDALSWLLSDASDFETVCDNAGLDPDYVHTKAKKALARGCQWRLPVGQGWRTLAKQAEQSATQREPSLETVQ